jgi:hypothetical protein
VRLFLWLTVGLVVCLSGCASLGRETPAAPVGPASNPSAVCDPPQPGERPLAQVISRWRDRVDRCAERVGDDIDVVWNKVSNSIENATDADRLFGKLNSVLAEVPNYVENVTDADVTRCLVTSIAIAGYIVAPFFGHGCSVANGGCKS